MEDLLLLKYPAKAEKITALRGMGVADDEIESAMKDRIRGLLDQGVSHAEVNDALGFTEAQRSRVNEASRNNALEFVGRTWEMGHGEAKSLFETAETHNVPLHSLLNTPDMVKAIKEKDLGPLHERPTVEAFVAQNPGFARIDSPVYRTVGGVASGFLASEATFWRGVEWLTHWDKAKQWGDSLMDMSTSVSKSVMEGKDPNLWDATMQGLGSTAFFLIPGMIAGYGVGAPSWAILERLWRCLSTGYRWSFTPR